MKFYCLGDEERAATGYTHAFDFSATDGDFPAGIATNTDFTVTLAAAPVGLNVKRVGLRLVKALKDASDAAYNDTTIDVGDSNSATRFISGVQINENGTEVINVFDADEDFLYTSGFNLQVNFNGMAAKTLSDIDVGKVRIYFKLFNAAALRFNRLP